MMKLGWFSTGTGQGSRDLLTHFYSKIKDGLLDADISVVFSNRDPGDARESDKMFDLVRSYDLVLETLSNKNFIDSLNRFDREKYDRAVKNIISKYDIDLIVLAGYMLIVSKELFDDYKMINLHPALPDGPKGSWRQVIEALIREKSLVTGTMVHVISDDVDRGPCISFSECYLEDLWDRHVELQTGENWLFEEIRQRQFAHEPILLSDTIAKIASGEVDLSSCTYESGGDIYTLPISMTLSVSRQLLG